MKEILQTRFFQTLVNKVLLFILISSTTNAQEKVRENFTLIDTLGESTEMGNRFIQPDNLYFLNMTREGFFTQHSLTRIDLDNKHLVRTDFCQDCSIGELDIMVEELLMELIAEDQISIVETKTIVQPKHVQKPVTDPETEPDQIAKAEDSLTSHKTWHYVAISITV